MYLNKITNLFINSEDFTNRQIIINRNIINIMCIETIASSKDIHDFILKKLSLLNHYDEQNLSNYLFNYLPAISITKVNNLHTAVNNLLNGFTLLIIDDSKILAVETKLDLTRSISITDYERSITGPKDSFNEQFNTNIGLIRRRIKSPDLVVKSLNIGKYSNTKIGILSINNITKPQLAEQIMNKLTEIKIDGIIDSGYLKNYLDVDANTFPTIKTTERPDLAAQALLEGKVIIITDTSPDILVLPTFFIDYFHTSDDYYQKAINVTFIRIVRLLAFTIAIFLPSYYIAVTTHNVDSIPISLLLNFISQRQYVPFPAFLEALLMIISFEILRESDIRIPSSMGSAISILGGLVLGEALVSAGLISPIMIIVVALSAVSGLIFQSIEITNAIRWWRFMLIILASFFGIYGIFIGIILIFINLAKTKSLNKDYLYPYAPININEQLDGFIKKEKSVRKRNPLISNNHIRGYK